MQKRMYRAGRPTLPKATHAPTMALFALKLLLSLLTCSRIRGDPLFDLWELPSMTYAFQGEVVSEKADKGADKLREKDSDRGIQKPEIVRTS